MASRKKCSQNQRRLCGRAKTECNECFERSLASHPNSEYWSSKNLVNPIDICKTNKNGTTYLFNCPNPDCKHEFEMTPGCVNEGQWCPYCGTHPKRLCFSYECVNCYNKSFASHPKSEFLFENTIDPIEIFKTQDIKMQFKCEKGHIFVSSVNNITRKKGIKWCSKCVNKTEGKLLLYLQKKYKVIVGNFEWCRSPLTKRFLPFDFYLPELGILVELDGGQHFRDVKYFKKSSDFQRSRDVYKMKTALQHNIRIIRLLQDDVCYDKNQWWIHLDKAIASDEKIEYIGGIIYDKHRADMLDDIVLIQDTKLENVLDNYDDKTTLEKEERCCITVSNTVNFIEPLEIVTVDISTLEDDLSEIRMETPEEPLMKQYKLFLKEQKEEARKQRIIKEKSDKHQKREKHKKTNQYKQSYRQKEHKK